MLIFVCLLLKEGEAYGNEYLGSKRFWKRRIRTELRLTEYLLEMNALVVLAICDFVRDDFVGQLSEQEVKCSMLAREEVSVTRTRSWWSDHRGLFC